MRSTFSKLLCAVLLLLTLCGCAARQPEQELQQPFTLWFVSNADSITESETIFAAEQIDLADFPTYPNSYVGIINHYLEGTTQELYSPFPANLQCLSAKRIDDTLFVLLSSEMASASGVDLSLSIACMFRTFTQFSGVEKVHFTCSGQTFSGLLTRTYSADDFLFELPTKE